VHDQRHHRGQGYFQGLGAALPLGEQQPALQGCERGRGELARDSAAQLAAGLHAAQPGADRVLPARKLAAILARTSVLASASSLPSDPIGQPLAPRLFLLLTRKSRQALKPSRLSSVTSIGSWRPTMDSP
jgi:hypothetical protein